LMVKSYELALDAIALGGYQRRLDGVRRQCYSPPQSGCAPSLGATNLTQKRLGKTKLRNPVPFWAMRKLEPPPSTLTICPALLIRVRITLHPVG
jgi:hypothetical protein